MAEPLAAAAGLHDAEQDQRQAGTTYNMSMLFCIICLFCLRAQVHRCSVCVCSRPCSVKSSQQMALLGAHTSCMLG